MVRVSQNTATAHGRHGAWWRLVVTRRSSMQCSKQNRPNGCSCKAIHPTNATKVCWECSTHNAQPQHSCTHAPGAWNARHRLSVSSRSVMSRSPMRSARSTAASSSYRLRTWQYSSTAVSETDELAQKQTVWVSRAAAVQGRYRAAGGPQQARRQYARATRRYECMQCVHRRSYRHMHARDGAGRSKIDGRDSRRGKGRSAKGGLQGWTTESE